MEGSNNPSQEVEELESGEVEKPKQGMCFTSKKEVYAFYAKYAKHFGFAIAYGTQNFAKVRGSLQKDGTFKLTTIVLKHALDLVPSDSRYFAINKRILTPVKRRLEINDEAEIGVVRNFHFMVVEAGGFEALTFDERDAMNHIEKARRLRLGVGDAESVAFYFHRMQQKNSNFYYEMDFDGEGRLRNLFWADARSRAAYKAFGDVVTFDTTYLTNKYDMSFALFVGVNHHRQSFVWLWVVM
ncbi:protein FAR-RED IMPAIRED RESPONSE 1-like [Camellia sinensis]|uniref:protein FAR-RED IMPAIRED RESPONSE 1-like n=1 Tax=Camellia sinensis TaxID=4442 RepID=UPI001035EA70|nr:protein FAR-RED IMPAIRED RESPONSE 1-like [Camellia sinensis]